MPYGASVWDLCWNAATFADKVLKDFIPAEKPVEHSTNFELVVNQKATEALRLEFPEPFLPSTTKLIR